MATWNGSVWVVVTVGTRPMCVVAGATRVASRAASSRPRTWSMRSSGRNGLADCSVSESSNVTKSIVRRARRSGPGRPSSAASKSSVGRAGRLAPGRRVPASPVERHRQLEPGGHRTPPAPFTDTVGWRSAMGSVPRVDRASASAPGSVVSIPDHIDRLYRISSAAEPSSPLRSPTRGVVMTDLIAPLTPTRTARGARVQPLSGHTGALIHGIDIARPLDPEERQLIGDALDTWKVVFFRDQHLGHAEQIAFTRQFGELTYAHPYDNDPPEGFPEIYTIVARAVRPAVRLHRRGGQGRPQAVLVHQRVAHRRHAGDQPARRLGPARRRACRSTAATPSSPTWWRPTRACPIRCGDWSTSSGRAPLRSRLGPPGPSAPAASPRPTR